MSLAIQCYGLTDVGTQRPSNQDQFVIADIRTCMQLSAASFEFSEFGDDTSATYGKLLLVADGMGGQAGGKRASTIAASVFCQTLLADSEAVICRGDSLPRHMPRLIDNCIRRCHEVVRNAGAMDPRYDGMGTTLTAAVTVGSKLFVGHVGDSRCYLLRDRHLVQVTKDHTLSQLFKERSPVSAEGRRQEFPRWDHVLWNVIGGHSEEISPEIYTHELEVDDVLLLASDGLTKDVEESVVEHVLITKTDPEVACDRLIRMAKHAGGSDNITVVVAHAAEWDPAKADTRVSGEPLFADS